MCAKNRKNKSIISVREKKLNNENVSLYLDIYHEGKRYYEFLKLYIKDNPRTVEERQQYKDNLQIAERIRSRRETEIIESEHGYVPANKSRTNFLLYFERYLDSYPNKDKRIIKAAYERFKDFIDSDSLEAREITDNMLLRFKKYLDNNYNGETPYNYFKKLKKVIRQAQKDKIILTDPAAGIKNTRSEGLKKEILSFEEINRLAGTPCSNQEVKKAFLFSLQTGLRFCDVCEVRWKNADNDKLIIKSQQKTKKPVYIDLNQTALKLMGKRGKPQQLIFELPTGNGANKVLKSWVKQAKIPKHITWHCARHSFGVNLLILKNDIKTVSGLLGHSDLKQTEVYTTFVDELKRKAVDSLPELDL